MPVAHLGLFDIPGLRSALVDYHCMLKAKVAMDQFAEGLRVLNVLKLMQKYPSLAKPYSVSDGKNVCL